MNDVHPPMRPHGMQVRAIAACLAVFSMSKMGCVAEPPPPPDSWSFVPAEGSPIESLPKINGLAAADFNRDGQIDLAGVNGTPGELIVLLNQGDARFAPAPRLIAKSDDAAVTELQPGRLPVGPVANGVVTPDVNHDGLTDILMSFHDRDEITLLLGNGDGTFEPPVRRSIYTRTAGAPHIHMIALADMNGDGHDDIVFQQADDNLIAWGHGDGAGGFSPSLHSFAAATRCYSQAVIDINADGFLDVVAPCIDRSQVVVWLAEEPAALRFRRIEFPTPGTDSQVMAIADFNGDGLPDVATAGWNQPTITVLLGRGSSGTMAAPTHAPAPATVPVPASDR